MNASKETKYAQEKLDELNTELDAQKILKIIQGDFPLFEIKIPGTVKKPILKPKSNQIQTFPELMNIMYKNEHNTDARWMNPKTTTFSGAIALS